MASTEVSVDQALVADNARLRLAGGRMAEAALRVVHHYDGTHRLALAVAGWCEAVAAEGGRPHPVENGQG